MMKTFPLYIQSACQLSVQQPLSESWMESPISYERGYHRSIDPNYRDYFTMNEARRMSRLLKRAVLTSREAVKAAGIDQAEAVIACTGLGCVESTEILMSTLHQEDETTMKPACFMQSTHNMISSAISMDLKCYGYNTTFSHNGFSLGSVLEDAFIQAEKGTRHILVGAYDEITPNLYAILLRTGYLDKEMNGFSGETAVSMILEREKTSQTLCRIDGVEMIYRPSASELSQTLECLLKSAGCPLALLDGVMIGTNGNASNDAEYAQYVPELFGEVPLLQYKSVFGESPTASALGLYASAICLSRHYIPAHLFIDQKTDRQDVHHILLYHQFKRIYHTFILLSC